MEIINTVKIGVTFIFSLFLIGLMLQHLIKAITCMSKAIKLKKGMLTHEVNSNNDGCVKMANQYFISALILLFILIILNLLLPEMVCNIYERISH